MNRPLGGQLDTRMSEFRKSMPICSSTFLSLDRPLLSN